VLLIQLSIFFSRKTTYTCRLAISRLICSNVENFLSESCDDLVTSDGNALTLEGKRALERIACGGQAILGVLLTNNLLAALQARC
jgi:hypothetical protein